MNDAFSADTANTTYAVQHVLPGPQTVAYQPPADVVGYGGAAGGGKTDLALGLAITAHRHSLILRREAVHLRVLQRQWGAVPA